MPNDLRAIRSGFWGHGPVWITAISGLIAALTGVAVFVLSPHAGTPPDTSAGPTPSPQTLGHYPHVVVPRMSGITFTGGTPRVTVTPPTGADLEVWSDTPDLTSRRVSITRLDRPEPDYQSCVSNKNPADDYIKSPTVGIVGCFIGDGLVAGFKVVATTPDPWSTGNNDGGSITFDILMWKSLAP